MIVLNVSKEELSKRLSANQAIPCIQIIIDIDLEEIDEEEFTTDELYAKSGLQEMVLQTCGITQDEVIEKMNQSGSAILGSDSIFVLPDNKFELTLNFDTLNPTKIEVRISPKDGDQFWDATKQKELIKISEKIYSGIKKKFRMAA